MRAVGRRVEGIELADRQRLMAGDSDELVELAGGIDRLGQCDTSVATKRQECVCAGSRGKANGCRMGGYQSIQKREGKGKEIRKSSKNSRAEGESLW